MADLLSPTSDFTELVAELQALGVPRDKAIAAVERRLGRLVAPVTTLERDDRVLEKAEQAEIVKRFRVCGFEVYSLSQPRASKQTPGLPDLWCMHRARPLALWWETKRQVGGDYSEAQLRFARDARRCDVGYGSGDRFAAARWLIDHELATTLGAVLEPIASPTTAATPPTTLSALMDAWPSIMGAARAGDVWITGFDAHGRLHLSVGHHVHASTTQLENELRPRLPASLDDVAITRIVWHRNTSNSRNRIAGNNE